MPCEKIPFGDGVMILCSDRRSRKRCRYCSHWSDFQCDSPVIRKGIRRTCDVHLCARHRRKIGDNVDLCPAHATQYELNGNRFAIGDVALDPLLEPASTAPAKLPTDPRLEYYVQGRGEGRLSRKGTNGQRSWIKDRSKAELFPGGAALDATVRAHKLQLYVAERSLFPEKEKLTL